MTTAKNDLTVEQALAQAHSHWQAGQADQAERLCQQVLAIWPGQADALHLMGLMAHAYGNLDLAIDHLRRACLAPRAPAIYVSNLAEMCRQAGQLAEAEQAGRRAVAMDNALVAGWNNLGIILQEAGKLEESLTCLERVVALQPNSPEAHNNLGNTLKRMGRLDQAQGHYRQALALAPGYSEAMSNLSNLLTDLGQFDAALGMARQAIDENPRLSDAYINAAAVEVSRDRYPEALRWVDALLSYAPIHANGLSVRSTVLRRMGRLDEALADARRAVAAAPHSGEALNILGEALQALDQIDDALAAFDAAAATVGFAAEKAMVNRGVVLMEQGDTQAAKTAFDAVLARNPRSASAWFNLADLHRFAPGDPAIPTMEALVAPGNVQSQNDRTALHFALAKAWMDAGDPERAFAYLDEGNRQKRATFTYDAQAVDAWFSQIIESFPADMVQRPKPAVAGSDLAVFVVGMPRSGTTLIEQILASHPAVRGAGELGVLPALVGQSGGWPALAGQLTEQSESALGQAYLDAIRPLAGNRVRLVDKMPSNFMYAGLINRVLPDAKIIHVRRDAVDTCLSCYSKLFTREQLFSYDQAELALFHRGYTRLMDHWRAILLPDRFIEVDYEDVVADTETQARRLVAFCGLDWNPACLDFHLTRRTIRTASLNQVRRPIYTGSIGRWRSYASQIAVLLDGLGIDTTAKTKDGKRPAAPARGKGKVAP